MSVSVDEVASVNKTPLFHDIVQLDSTMLVLAASSLLLAHVLHAMQKEVKVR